ncbi:hypothetical protein FRX31_030146 [Thalictrum thalictroides]|uniref:Uncharacterized protein n=1 Tax=Thalictrum thalictroides TaxID=46969 RepID=A0A7J6V7W2_THATH|nr:hypothetical protein FRX31_030146 [Thalictrum thalictroides]
MDLETENQIASILMKEAAELRRQAEKEGVNVYLRERNVRFRPNSRFLTATVLGVQQANRVAEVNEMWRVRKKELELNDKRTGTSRDNRSHHDSPRRTISGHREHNDSLRNTSMKDREHNSHFASSSKTEVDDTCSSEDGGLKDEDVVQFLHSRVKRGRGGVGPRMDEPGPFLPRMASDSKSKLSVSADVREREEGERRILGPEKPTSLKSSRYLEDYEDTDDWKKAKKVKLESSKKHLKKHQRKDDKHAKKERKDDKHVKEDRKERKSKHKHKSRRS